MKVFTALMATETNTFCPIPTTLEDFVYGIGEESVLGDYFKAFRKMAEAHGWDVQHGPSYFASPAGTVVRSAYETIKADLLKAIKDAMPMDALVLALHGAMYTDGYPDTEGDFLKAARDLLGADIPIGVELDSHCHLTDTMVDAADIIVIFKEWPHTDMLDRAEETMDFTLDMAEGKIKPHMAMYDPRMICPIDTYQEPGRTLVDDIKKMEGKDGVLSVSIGHSFQWTDFPDVGNKVLVVTDNQPEKGAELAEQIGRRVFDLRHDLAPKHTRLEDAFEILANATEFPILLSESFDCMAGGAAGDSTYMIRGMIEHG
ncbi:MAG: M81 family metallopeptidase, partial [Deltaproteobacteria bacterium]|nr:M81 family metallopeptidase [Deltaproteobacteria bacterium]